jgi:sugar phosphate isomerase/epimerase
VTTYSISTSVAEDAPRAVALEAIAQAGFRHVELVCDEGHLDDWMADPAGMRRDLEAHGLTALSVHLPPLACNVGHPDAAIRQAAIEVAVDTFRQAREVGAGIVICHPNTPDNPFTSENFADGMARSRASLAEMAGHAAEIGVRMAVENLPARHLPRPGSTIAHVLELIDGLSEDVAGICLDVGHANANEKSAAQEALAAGDRLLALHLQDNDGLGQDQHLLPGRGTTDWDAFLRAMAELNGRDGSVAVIHTFEVKPVGSLAATLEILAGLRDQWTKVV